jgi:hypothetical protein
LEEGVGDSVNTYSGDSGTEKFWYMTVRAYYYQWWSNNGVQEDREDWLKKAVIHVYRKPSTQ